MKGPSVPVDTGLRPPVTRPAEPEEEGDLPTRSGSEDEGDDYSSTITLHLEPVPSSQDVSRASSKAGEGSSAGPPRSKGLSSPAAVAPSTTQAPVQWARQRDRLLRRHVQAVKRIEAAVSRKIEADLKWRQQAWGQFLQWCDWMCDVITTLTSHIGHAVHYSMALPHPPAMPPMLPPAAPPAAPPLPLLLFLQLPLQPLPCPHLLHPVLPTSLS
ncbi:uncharacterized protein LOC142829826 [Pelodiscus sinensis]|uniref:uncharacterized protein LOC142829826 n=1 Tax=Pelodiscus sinensis TaxID=13735 RepID=UPI003F6CC037